MPFVNVQTIKGIMTAEQKSELLRRMTDLLVEIEGQGDPQFRQSVWIRICLLYTSPSPRDCS